MPRDVCCSRILRSTDQSEIVKHSPTISRWFARSASSAAAISRLQRSISSNSGHSFRGDVTKSAVRSIESSLQSNELLPSLNDHVAIFRIQLDPVTNALG